MKTACDELKIAIARNRVRAVLGEKIAELSLLTATSSVGILAAKLAESHFGGRKILLGHRSKARSSDLAGFFNRVLSPDQHGFLCCVDKLKMYPIGNDGNQTVAKNCLEPKANAPLVIFDSDEELHTDREDGTKEKSRLTNHKKIVHNYHEKDVANFMLSLDELVQYERGLKGDSRN
jgi:hypothetical protein